MDTKLVIAIAVPLGLGTLAGLMTKDEARGPWYDSLKKPSWSPPSWLFSPVWITLYVLMGIASWRVWVRGRPQDALVLYGIQLALNLVWSFVFFKAHSLRWSLINIVSLLAVIAATIASFRRVDPTAAYLMAPYFAWVAFATALNANIFLQNP